MASHRIEKEKKPAKYFQEQIYNRRSFDSRKRQFVVISIMSDNSEGNQPQNSEAVSSIRSNIRESLKVNRDDKRIKTIDSIRVGIGELVNLKNYTAADVIDIAGRIKQQKNAKPKDLNCLAHAFIQSSDNITCFLNITGALNVLVKELTGKGVEINSNNYDHMQFLCKRFIFFDRK